MKYSKRDLIEVGKENREQYAAAEPFPNIYLDGVFDEVFLSTVLEEIKAMDRSLFSYGSKGLERKGGNSNIETYGPNTTAFFSYLNSGAFLLFLETLTGIEGLISDPHYYGGGIHEILPGGLLKIHADFNRHNKLKLDRRLNVLIYMNKDWKPEYGGDFELWNKDMSKAVVKISPLFNRMAVFSTTSDSYHGHPDPLTCPPDRSRMGLNLYYYSNGRPAHENSRKHSTLFQSRKGNWTDRKMMMKHFLKQFVPPIAYRVFK